MVLNEPITATETTVCFTGNTLVTTWASSSSTVTVTVAQAEPLTRDRVEEDLGLDLFGSLQGAGGIGGLLAVIRGTNAYSPTFDGNGNVSEYVDASGEIAAHYEYSPFGETIVATGPNASDFLHRFSTKPAEDNTGLVLYEYRPYSPSLGRWPTRDPIGEKSYLNLYNAQLGVNSVDLFGLTEMSRGDVRPWQDVEIEGRSLMICNPPFGECNVKTTFEFRCQKEVGLATFEVAITEFWYATGLRHGSEMAKKAEYEHYELTRALHKAGYYLALSHNNHVYKNECDCRNMARDHSIDFLAAYAGYKLRNVAIEVRHQAEAIYTYARYCLF